MVAKNDKNWKLIDRFDWTKPQNCHHCGCSVVRAKSGQKRNKDNTATIDHIFSRYDIRRACVNGSKWVLSCHKCNDHRCRVDNRRMQQINFDYDMWDRSVHLITFYRLSHSQLRLGCLLAQVRCNLTVKNP